MPTFTDAVFGALCPQRKYRRLRGDPGGINQRTITSIVTDLSLTDDERRLKLEQLADNEIRAIQEQRDLEDSEHELFDLNLPGLPATKR